MQNKNCSIVCRSEVGVSAAAVAVAAALSVVLALAASHSPTLQVMRTRLPSLRLPSALLSPSASRPTLEEYYYRYYENIPVQNTPGIASANASATASVSISTHSDLAHLHPYTNPDLNQRLRPNPLAEASTRAPLMSDGQCSSEDAYFEALDELNVRLEKRLDCRSGVVVRASSAGGRLRSRSQSRSQSRSRPSGMAAERSGDSEVYRERHRDCGHDSADARTFSLIMFVSVIVLVIAAQAGTTPVRHKRQPCTRREHFLLSGSRNLLHLPRLLRALHQDPPLPLPLPLSSTSL